MKQLIRKFIPKFIISAYHYVLSTFAAVWYRFPSREMMTIGVTGTKGKSTTVYLLGHILRAVGRKVGWTSTISFSDGVNEQLNPIKMTMPGRFFLERYLRRMKTNRAEMAIVETSSEGIAQHRNAGIDYAGAIFTNLAPEHLESHGGYENYKRAKGVLFRAVAKRRQPGFVIINLDDEEAPYFIQASAGARVYGFTEKNLTSFAGVNQIFQLKNVTLSAAGVAFDLAETQFQSPLLGRVNVWNLAAAIVAALVLGLPAKELSKAVPSIKSIPGRLEFIIKPNGDNIIVDYAHTPQSIEALYAALEVVSKKRVIHVLGPTGGGRDQEKIQVMGELVGQYADIVMVTTDDPYFADPHHLAEPMLFGATEEGKTLDHNLFWIADRALAIKKALELQQPGDLVVITGKGSEQKMAIGGEMIDWDDREAVREIIGRPLI